MAYRYSGLLIALCITALTIDASNKKTSFSFLSAFSLAPLVVLPKTTATPTRMPIPIAQKPTEEKKFNPLDLLPHDIWSIIDAYTGHSTLHANARSFLASREQPMICSVAWNPKENSFASGDSKGTVRIWDAKTHTEKYRIKHSNTTIYSINYSPDAEYLVSAEEDSILLWNCNNNEPAFTVKHVDRGRRAVFDRDGSRIALCRDKHLSLWDIHHQRATNNFSENQTSKAFTGFGGVIDMCWLHHNPALVCAVNLIGRAYLIDIRGKGITKALGTSNTSYASSQITCSSDDNCIMWINNNTVARYDIKADKSLPSIIAHSDTRNQHASLHLSNDDQKILLSTRNSLYMFETANGKNLESRGFSPGQSGGFTPELLCAAWSPDERHIIAGDLFGYIYHLQQPSLLDHNLN